MISVKVFLMYVQLLNILLFPIVLNKRESRVQYSGKKRCPDGRFVLNDPRSLIKPSKCEENILGLGND